MEGERQARRRRWRYYRTPVGAEPVRDFLGALEPADRDAVRAAMVLIRRHGRSSARHLRHDIYEVRARRAGRAWRVLFAAVGRDEHVLLALEGIEKKSQATPSRALELAEARLVEWRRRGRGA